MLPPMVEESRGSLTFVLRAVLHRTVSSKAILVLVMMNATWGFVIMASANSM